MVTQPSGAGCPKRISDSMACACRDIVWFSQQPDADGKIHMGSICRTEAGIGKVCRFQS